jgi:hypothetical protein
LKGEDNTVGIRAITSIINCIRSYFFKKNCGEDYIRTIVVLTGGKLTGIYFLYLLYVNYFSITTHLRHGKKVTILVPGDVNYGLIASR